MNSFLEPLSWFLSYTAPRKFRGNVGSKGYSGFDRDNWPTRAQSVHWHRKTSWREFGLEQEIISDNVFNKIFVNATVVPVRIGKIPYKIQSGFVSFTSNQWQTGSPLFIDCTLFTWCTEWIWSRMSSLCSGQLITPLQRNYHCSTLAGWCSFCNFVKEQRGCMETVIQ